MKKTLAIMLALIMVLALVPTVAFAAGNTIYVDANNGDDANNGTETKPYKTVEAAAKAAASGDTIMLGEGKYTLYGVSSVNTTKGKNLTFVGQGADKTFWGIGAAMPDSANFGTEYNGDYSFDGAGTITFRNMTLQSGAADYLGFIRADNTIVENCTMFGKTFYWGYKSAKFTNTTFNCPDDDYALWYYTGTEMSFDNCTFNASGKVIHAYREGTAENPLVLNFKDCKVVSSAVDKSVLNIKDANNYYTVNISGTNTVEGLKPNKITCSRLFQVECYADNYNLSGGKGNSEKYQATVNIDGIPVWQGGKMVSHKYTDGYKDDAFIITKDDTLGYVKTCKHCGYTEPFYGELSNEIGLKRTVNQNSNPVPEDAANSNKYKVANSSNITVDYTATMDMTKLKWEKQGSLYDDEITPWQMLAMQPGWITEDTVVFLNFTFDKNIDLKAFKDKYNTATTPTDKEKLLKLESDMFEMTDVAFGPGNTMTIKCNWNWNKETDPDHAPDPKITLNGCGLPVKSDWNGSKQINIENSGCVRGTVHIKYINPRPYAKMIAETVVPNVAANVQVQNTTPPVDNTIIKIPIVGGCKTDEFTLYYGGGSSGDDHSHYYPTTTPVPVIVIPPKTGDMTVWQSILHFLGIR